VKIGIFSPTLNVFGGGEYVALAIANTLAINGHKVILFTNNKVSNQTVQGFFGETFDDSIQIVTQPTYFTSRGLADFYQTIIHSRIAKSKCDVFIDAFSNCVFPWSNVSYIHFPFLNEYWFNRRFPYLGSPHLLQAGTTPYVLIEKNLVNYSNKLVLANSQYTADKINKYSEKRVEVLYPPFSSNILELGKNFTKQPTSDLVVTTSRFQPNKLLERIPYIAAKTPSNIRFAVMGRLYCKDTLSALQQLVNKLNLSDRVKFYPDATQHLKLELLKEAKIYLHTMVGEHFGISIVEAMALGCLPVVHDSGGIVEYVPHPYRYQNTQGAADNITEQISQWSTKKTEEIKQIAQQFSMEKFSNRFMELFSKYYSL
jgi:glycosyltransferase involved in cell wall biosynthesis